MHIRIIPIKAVRRLPLGASLTFAIKYAAVAAGDGRAARRGGQEGADTCGFLSHLTSTLSLTPDWGRRLPSFCFACGAPWRRTGFLGIQWMGASARPDRPDLTRPRMLALRLRRAGGTALHVGCVGGVVSRSKQRRPICCRAWCPHHAARLPPRIKLCAPAHHRKKQAGDPYRIARLFRTILFNRNHTQSSSKCFYIQFLFPTAAK